MNFMCEEVVGCRLLISIDSCMTRHLNAVCRVMDLNFHNLFCVLYLCGVYGVLRLHEFTRCVHRSDC